MNLRDCLHAEIFEAGGTRLVAGQLACVSDATTLSWPTQGDLSMRITVW